MASEKVTPALKVAQYLVKLAGADEEYLTHLRLQKLLYYCQGWSLALRGRELFPDRIEAWVHGPVVRKVWSHFQKYDWKLIPPDEVDTASLPKQDAELVGQVWEAYNGFSAARLRDMTHQEDPWKEARGKLSPNARSSAIITQTSMRKHFRRLAEAG